MSQDGIELDTSLGYLNGTVAVLMNVGHEPLDLPAGTVLLRSSAAAGINAPEHQLGSGETVWLEIYIEDTES